MIGLAAGVCRIEVGVRVAAFSADVLILIKNLADDVRRVIEAKTVSEDPQVAELIVG
jgi:hypothetical protein